MEFMGEGSQWIRVVESESRFARDFGIWARALMGLFRPSQRGNCSRLSSQL